MLFVYKHFAYLQKILYLCKLLIKKSMNSTKSIKSEGKTKYLRIDNRTIIEVSVDIPDHVARENYMRNRELNNPGARRNLVIK